VKKLNQNVLLFSQILLISMFIGACATKSYININYRLPLSSDSLKGENFFIKLTDVRSDKSIFGKNAKTEFKNFTGIFSFSLDMGKKKNFVVGAFDLPSLFKEAFSKRLENVGIEVLTDQEKTAPVLEIVLQDVVLDLVDRKWVAEISYEARLIKDNILIAKESINGKAERTKVFRQKDAEKVLGDIFTAVINKLDVHKLLEQANR
jgi:hypothetical protein